MLLDFRLSTTPTEELAVLWEIRRRNYSLRQVISNPVNALNFWIPREFESDEDGNPLEKARKEEFYFRRVKKLVKYSQIDDYMDRHISMCLNWKLVDVRGIIEQEIFKIVETLY